MAMPEEQFLILLKMKSELGEVIKRDGRDIQRETRKIDGSLDRMRRSMGDVARVGRSVFRTLTPGWRTLAASILSVAAAQQAAARSADFRLGMAEVATILPDAADGAHDLSKEVLALAVAQNKLEGDVTKGLYDTISAGFNKAGDSMKVLGASSELATAGVSTTGESVDLTTTSLNAYNLAAEQSGRVTDVWFTTVRQGKTTIPELAGAVGRVIPLASTLGVTIEELGAALATATAQGQDTSLATTNQLALLKSLLSRQKEVNAVFQRSGETYDLNTLATKGLGHVVKVLSENTRDAAEMQEVLGGSVEALNGFLSISGAAFKSYQANLEATRNSAGNVSKALEKIRGTDAFKVQQAIRAMKIETIGFGDAINGALADGIEQFGGLERLQETIRAGLAGLTPIMEKLVGLGATWLGDFKDFVPTAELATAKAQLFLFQAEEVARTLAGLVPSHGNMFGRDNDNVLNGLRTAASGGGVSQAVLMALPGNFNQQLGRIDEIDAALAAARNATVDRRPTVNMGGLGRSRQQSQEQLAAAREITQLTEERAQLEQDIRDRAKEALDAALKREKDLLDAQRQRAQLQRDAEKRVADLERQSAKRRMHPLAGGSDRKGQVPVAGFGLEGMPGGPSIWPSMQPADNAAIKARMDEMTRAAQQARLLKEASAQSDLAAAEAARQQLEYSLQLNELQLRGATTDEERLAIGLRLHEVQRQMLVTQAQSDGRTAEEIERLAAAFDELKPKADAAAKAVDRFQVARDQAIQEIQGAAANDLGNFFVDFLSGAKSSKEAMRDFATSMLADIGRILAQKAALQIIGSAGSDGQASTGLMGLLGFASGGIGPAGMGSTRPLPVHAYSMGGVASSPQVGVFGEGRNREAFVPLPDNRTIPVTLKGDGGGGGTTIQINMPVSTMDSRSFDEGIEQRSASIARAITRELKGNALLRGQVRRVAGGRG